jgi:hypothetical protein
MLRTCRSFTEFKKKREVNVYGSGRGGGGDGGGFEGFEGGGRKRRCPRKTCGENTCASGESDRSTARHVQGTSKNSVTKCAFKKEVD